MYMERHFHLPACPGDTRHLAALPYVSIPYAGNLHAPCFIRLRLPSRAIFRVEILDDP